MNSRLRAALGIAALSLAQPIGCKAPPAEDDTPATEGETDTTDTDTDAIPSGLTWTNGIDDVFQQNCVRCHAAGQFTSYAPLQTWFHVSKRLEAITQKIVYPPGWMAQMPPYPGGSIPGTCEPAHPYSNDLRLSQETIDSVLAWINSGAPEGGANPDEPLVHDPRPTLDGDLTDYPFDEGYEMKIDYTDPNGHKDDYVCVIVDPGTIQGDRWLSGIQINPEIPHVFRGARVWLDPDRDSLAHVGSQSTRTHGANWYDCTDGFGFEGEILAGFLPEGEPIALPPGSAVVIPGDALLVYKIHYHAHYDHENPEDTGELPDELSWFDHTSLSLRWEDEADVTAVAQMLTFGNYPQAAQAGSGSLTVPFGIPGQTSSHTESMVTVVPGTAADAYQVWAIQVEMRDYGKAASVTASSANAGTEQCLGAIPLWGVSWQIPVTYDPAVGAPTVNGGDRLRIDCTYMNASGTQLDLDDESCRAMVGLVPMD